MFSTNIKGVEAVNDKIDFDNLKERFKKADLNEKIKIYTNASGLTVDQFKELLRLYPLKHLDKLEKAM